MHATLRTLAALAAAALATAPAAAQHAGARTPAPAAPHVTPIAPALAAATFDTAWAVVHRTLWDTAVANGAWEKARTDLRPRALQARSVEELRAILGEMVGRLGYSHFEVIPGEVSNAMASSASAGTGDPGMDVRLSNDRILVTRVDSVGPAWAAGVRPGWIVQSVGAHTTANLLALLRSIPGAREARGRQLYAWSIASGWLRGNPGSTLRVRFVDGGDRTVEKAIALRAPVGTSQKLGNLPPLTVWSQERRVAVPGGGTAGVIRFNYWLPVVMPALNAAVDSLRDTDGIIVDLRGNLGGLGAMAPGFAGHFLSKADTLGVMRMRGQTLYLVSNPRRVDTQARPVAPYDRPVAVLTDAMTASTSEFFAGGLQQLGRVRVFGEPSAAQALPAVPERLPDGDVLMHAVADFTGPTGKRFEGLGVTPDVPAPPTRAALLAGHDPALEAALAWIHEQNLHRAPSR